MITDKKQIMWLNYRLQMTKKKAKNMAAISVSDPHYHFIVYNHKQIPYDYRQKN